MNDLPVPTVLLVCVLSFPLHPHGGKASVQASSHQLRELEKKLRVYLSSRVLVFRKGEIGRHQIKFNSRGYVSAESGSEFASPANAILFIDLTLTSERAVISGEAVRVRPRTSQRIQACHLHYHPGCPAR
jgi:hypothetical protein